MNRNDIAAEIGEIILNIAHDNEDFICETCLNTAAELYRFLSDHVDESLCFEINEQFCSITGRNLDD